MSDESKPDRERDEPRNGRKPSDGSGSKQPRNERKSSERKPYERSGQSGERKPYDRSRADGNAGERKPYDKTRSAGSDRKPYDRGGKPGERKPYDRGRSDGKPGERKPYDRARSDGKPGERKPYDRSRSDGKPGERKPYDRGRSDGKPGERKPYDRAGGRPSDSRPPRDEDTRPRHDDPLLPEDIEAKQLDKGARIQLKTLSKENADWVARHLVMVGRLIDDDPELAHKHALAAARRAGRIGVVRETTAITAYATGDFALALRELRTYRRITGREDQLPLMVDSERGVGRPQAALELGRSVPRDSLDADVQVALAIAMSGARLDLGQAELALTELQIPQLDPERAFAYSPALFDAYATVLEELGRDDEAEQWWQRSDRASIALEQAAIPEGQDTVEIIEEFFDDSGDDTGDEA